MDYFSPSNQIEGKLFVLDTWVDVLDKCVSKNTMPFSGIPPFIQSLNVCGVDLVYFVDAKLLVNLRGSCFEMVSSNCSFEMKELISPT